MPELGATEPTGPGALRPAEADYPALASEDKPRDPIAGAATQLWRLRAVPPALPDPARSGRRKRPRIGRPRRRPTTPSSDPRDFPAAVERSIGSYDPVTAAEACGFAVRFAADYLSWDEDEPERRGAALRQYLADPRAAVLGWNGIGRQRAELVVPGRTVEFQAAIVVEINARVVLYERTGPPPARLRDRLAATDDPNWPPLGEATPPHAANPSSAPAPTASGWAPGAGWWVPLAPPVRRHSNGRLVIDLGLDLSATS